MRILLPNNQLAPIADLLSEMSLKPAASRARTKLLHLVREANIRFAADEYDLVCQYAVLNSAGKPVIDPGGTFSLADPVKAQEFFTARSELFESVAEVSGPTYTGHLTDLKTLLDNFDNELSGAAAEAFDVLVDATTVALTKEGSDS